MRDKIKAVIDEMTENAGLSEEFADSFFNTIIDDEEVLNEFITYVKTGEFLSKNSVAGYTIVDIMVFQIDRFKAFLDRDTHNTKYNECHMILLAFDTFMKMKQNPEKYVGEMTGISGSDYDGKF